MLCKLSYGSSSEETELGVSCTSLYVGNMLLQSTKNLLLSSIPVDDIVSLVLLLLCL